MDLAQSFVRSDLIFLRPDFIMAGPTQPRSPRLSWAFGSNGPCEEVREACLPKNIPTVGYCLLTHSLLWMVWKPLRPCVVATS